MCATRWRGCVRPNRLVARNSQPLRLCRSSSRDRYRTIGASDSVAVLWVEPVRYMKIHLLPCRCALEPYLLIVLFDPWGTAESRSDTEYHHVSKIPDLSMTCSKSGLAPDTRAAAKPLMVFCPITINHSFVRRSSAPQCEREPTQYSSWTAWMNVSSKR